MGLQEHDLIMADEKFSEKTVKKTIFPRLLDKTAWTENLTLPRLPFENDVNFKVRANPDESPLKGGGPCCCTIDAKLLDGVTSGHAHLGPLGTVDLQRLPDGSLLFYFPAAIGTGSYPLLLESQDGKYLGDTTVTYYDDRVQKMVHAIALNPCLQRKFFHMCMQSSLDGNNEHIGDEKQSSGSLEFTGPVEMLSLAVYAAAECGAQQFIEMIFTSSAGRVVFDVYKKNQVLPEVIAKDHGNNETAKYLEGITIRFSDGSRAGKECSQTIDWSELVRAAEAAEKQLDLTSEKEDDYSQKDIPKETGYLGDIDTSSSESSEAPSSDSDDDISRLSRKEIQTKAEEYIQPVREAGLIQSPILFLKDGAFPRGKVYVKAFYETKPLKCKENGLHLIQASRFQEAHDLQQVKYLQGSGISLLRVLGNEPVQHHLITTYQRLGYLLTLSTERNAYYKMHVDTAEDHQYLEHLSTTVGNLANYKASRLDTIQQLCCRLFIGEFTATANREDLTVRGKSAECLMEHCRSAAPDFWVLTYTFRPTRKTLFVYVADSKDVFPLASCFDDRQYELLWECQQWQGCKNNVPKVQEIYKLLESYSSQTGEIWQQGDVHLKARSRDTEDSVADSYRDYKETILEFEVEDILSTSDFMKSVTIEEWNHMAKGSETKALPVIKKEGKYKSEKEYLHTYFKLLREECLHKITKGISDFLSKGKCDSKDMMLYRISLKGLLTKKRENSPTTMSIQLEFTCKLNSQETIDCGSTNWLRYGHLLCISFDETFNPPVWAMLEKVDHEQSVVWVTLCREKKHLSSEAEFIMRMQEIKDKGEKAYMAESQTCYLSFAPAMDILQHKEFAPFKEFLVYPEEGFKKKADYIEKISSPPDWGILFDLPPPGSDQPLPEDQSSTYSLLTEFERLKCSNIKKKLDDTQLEAVELALENKLTLIQGPPGTGKSYVGVTLVRLLLSMCVPKTFGPILVVTYRNNALDHFLEMCLDSSSSILRVGGKSSSNKLRDRLLSKVAQVWQEPLNTQKTKLTVQLQKIQDQVKDAYDKLERSSVFNAKMFLETASQSQIQELLMNMERTPCDQAEVEKLIMEKNAVGSKKSHLEGYVKNALEEWLPSQEEFDQFASRLSEKRSAQTVSASDNSVGKSKNTSPAGSSKRKNKVDQEQENPDDQREPYTEEDERLLSTLEYEIPVHDMKDVTVTQNTTGEFSTGERKLIRINKSRVEPLRIPLDGKKLGPLKACEKIRLVYALQSLYIEKVSAEFLKASKENVQKHQQYELLRNKHDIDVMRNYDVIGLTVTGAAMRANLLAELKPSVMIVEEAAEILEGQLVAVIPPSVQHLIMIGDHEQVRPLVQSKRLRTNNNLDISMFERLFNCGVPLKRLGFQARMMEEHVELLQKLDIYKERKTNYEEGSMKMEELENILQMSQFSWSKAEMQQAAEDLIEIRGKTERLIFKANVTAESFRLLADELDLVWRDCKTAHAYGTGASIAGGLLTLGGGVATFLTAGAATPLLMLGAAVGGAGAITQIAAGRIEASINLKELVKAQKDLEEISEYVNIVDGTIQKWQERKEVGRLLCVFRLALCTLKKTDPVVKILQEVISHLKISTDFLKKLKVMGTAGTKLGGQVAVGTVDDVVGLTLETGGQAADDGVGAGVKASANASKVAGGVIIGVSVAFLVWDAIDLSFTIKELIQERGSEAARDLREIADKLGKLAFSTERKVQL